MFKLVLEKAEELDIKLPTSVVPGSSPSGSREFKGGDGVSVLGKIHI